MKKNSFLYRLFKGLKYFYNSYVRSLDRSKFGMIDETVHLAPPLTFSNPSNVFLHGHNSLKDAKIFSTNAKFIMKPYAGSAEGLRVSTGNHAMIIGRHFRDIKEDEKPKGYDKDVIIDEEAWIGRNVTILQGVHVGRGAVVGAGSVLRNSIPPYAIVLGNPAKIVGFKFTPQEILEHEKILYSEQERIPEAVLVENHKRYFVSKIKDIKSFLNY